MNKRIKKALALILTLVMVGTILAGCSSSNGGESNGKAPGKKTQVIIATGGSAGTYYAVGAGLATLINKYSTNINAVSQGTNGAVENVRLVNSGNADIGITNWDALYFGANGQGPFAGQKQNIVGLMTMYLSGNQIAVLEKSGINSIADLKGKKVNIGPPGSVAIEMTKVMLKTYGIDPEKDIQAVNLSYDEGGSKLVDGDIDATVYLAGIPTSGIISISNSNKIKLLGMEDDKMAAVLAEYPYYDKVVIPSGTYKGVDADVQTLQAWTALIVNPNMSEEIANEIVKIILEHRDELQSVHAVLKDVTPENAKKMPIDIHPGAQKYFDEQK